MRHTLTVPQVDWDRATTTFGFYPLTDYSNLLLTCSARPAFVCREPPANQLPFLRDAAAYMLRGTIIKRTVGGAFCNRIFLVRKNDTESLFILDCSALTKSLKAPRFLLPPLARALYQNPLPNAPYFVKFDLSEAFYHLTLHPTSHSLYTFQLDHSYYRFTRLPFGIRTAPFFCQMLVNALTRHLRSRGLWVGGHRDNVLLVLSNPHFLYHRYHDFLTALELCGFRLNPNDTTFEPSRTIKCLGFELNGVNMTTAHLLDRVTLVHRILKTIRADMPLTYLRRAIGLRAFFLGLPHRLLPLSATV